LFAALAALTSSVQLLDNDRAQPCFKLQASQCTQQAN